MNKIFTLAAIATIGLASFCGCTKSTTTTYGMKANIPGGTFSSSLPTATGSFVNSAYVLTIVGTGAASSRITLVVNDWNGTLDTVALGPSSPTNSTGVYGVGSSAGVTADSGTVSIGTVSSTTIGGSFYFTNHMDPAVTGTFTAVRK